MTWPRAIPLIVLLLAAGLLGGQQQHDQRAGTRPGHHPTVGVSPRAPTRRARLFTHAWPCRACSGDFLLLVHAYEAQVVLGDLGRGLGARLVAGEERLQRVPPDRA